ncbi:MAG TPA: hypothetical protein VGI75_10915, partial [Pirellulales bacterium]
MVRAHFTSIHYLVLAELTAAVIALQTQTVSAGPYAPAAGQPGSTAIVYNDPSIVGWATSVQELTRGPLDIVNPGGDVASFGTGASALG